MNQAPRPRPVSDQRLLRLSLWLRLTIAWFTAHVLALVAPHAAARVLTAHARDARALLMLRAVRIAGFRRGVITAGMRRLTGRAVAGGRLRRALRTGTLSQRAQALCDALAAPERWIAYLVRRLRRGFSKLHCTPAPRREKAPATSAILRPAGLINSS